MRRSSGIVVVAPRSVVAEVRSIADQRGHVVLAACDDRRLADLDWASLHADGFELAVALPMVDALLASHPEVFDAAQRVRVFDPREVDLFRAPLNRTTAALKRTFDIVGAAALLLISAPVALIAMIAIRLDSPGPVLFRQERVGQHLRRFTVLKLRTMADGNDDSEHRRYIASLVSGNAERCDGMFKLVADPRITRVGRVLRKFSIDELPQLWNVLRGDMSLVGPRPELLSTMHRCSARSWLRLRVRPGLTGLWQVEGRCELPFHRMVELDNEYCERVNFALDLKILCRTPRAVLSGRGAA